MHGPVACPSTWCDTGDPVQRATLRLLAWAVAGFALAAATYLVMVRLRHGQRIDFSAYEGRKWTWIFLRRNVALLVRILTPVVVVAVAAASTAVAGVRRGAVAATAAALSVPVVLAVGSTLKAVLPRHELLPGSWISADNTFPSGHLAVVVVVMLVAVSVSPPAWRNVVTAAAVGVVTLQTLGVAASGWHRPSDLVGGLGVAVAVSGVASIPIVVQWRGERRRPDRPWFTSALGCVICLMATTYVGLVWIGIGRLLGRRSYGSFVGYTVIVVSIVIVGSIITLAHARLVDSVDRAVVR